MLKLQEAHAELEVKGYNQIQEETAWKWASRAAATFEGILSMPNETKHIYHSMGNSYFSEAMEHAAESGSPELVQKILDAVTPYQQNADNHLGDLLKEIK